MDNRSYVIERMKSKLVTIDEFNFDALSAPPLYSLITPTDVGDLHYLATSIKYSAKLDLKRKYIDEILNRRGFRLFGAGTNRVVYSFYEDNSFLLKTAIDDVGRTDNPAEFRNQYFLKPFVSKMFECSQCGTVSLVERGTPITSREMFRSIAEDVFTLINEFFVGEYVLADIGSKFFMNYAIRILPGGGHWGVILVDYPYLYRLDGNKLFCNAPDKTSPSGKCEGVIDYDAGFNFLHCTKCGAPYKAKDLELKIKKDEIVVKERGGLKNMKIRLVGGSKNVDKSVEINNPVAGVPSVPRRPLQSTQNAQQQQQKPYNNKYKKPYRNNYNQSPDKEKTVNGAVVDGRNITPKSPVGFDDSIKRQQVKPQKSTFDNINEKLIYIMDNLKYIQSENQLQSIRDKVFILVDRLNMRSMFEPEKVEAEEPEKNDLDIINESFAAAYDVLETAENDSRFDDINEYLQNESFIKILNEYTDLSIASGRYEILDNNRLEISVEPIITTRTVVDDEGEENCDELMHGSVRTINIDGLEFKNNDEVVEETVVSDVPESEESVEECVTPFNGFSFYSAKTMDIRDIDPEQESSKILAVTTSDGRYASGENGNMILIDIIDGQTYRNKEIVSSNWLEGIQVELAELKSQVSESNEELMEKEANYEEQEIDAKAPSVGAIPPEVVEDVDSDDISNLGVNGVVVRN